MSPERFEILTEGFIDDRLSDDEARELAEAVEASPELRARLLDAVTMAGLLARSEGTSKDLSAAVMAALRAPSEKDALVRNVLDHLPRRRRVWPWSLAAAALLALGLSTLFRVPPPAVAPKETPGAPATTFKDWENRDAAVAKAVAYLRTAKLTPSTHQGPMPADDLVLLALLEAGVPASDPFAAELLRRTLAAPLQRVYTVSLHAMALAKLGGHAERLEQCARFLVDNQSPDGRWGYGNATIPLPGTKQARTGQSGPNNSCTLFAAMGLRACAEAGVKIPRETLERGAQAWRNSQQPDADPGAKDRAGWCYLREEQDHHPYGSMSAGGLQALIALDFLHGRDPRKDAAVLKGLNWLTYHFTVLENFGPVEDLMAKEIVSDTPAPMTEFYYYMWMVERVGGTLGVVKMGDRDWYHEGAHELLMLQHADGSWFSGVKRCQPVWDTAYAILFLMRPTRPMELP